MLREMGVKGLGVTEKSGQVKTSKDELERVIDSAGDQFPLMAKIKRFREVAKGWARSCSLSGGTRPLNAARMGACGPTSTDTR